MPNAAPASQAEEDVIAQELPDAVEPDVAQGSTAATDLRRGRRAGEHRVVCRSVERYRHQQRRASILRNLRRLGRPQDASNDPCPWFGRQRELYVKRLLAHLPRREQTTHVSVGEQQLGHPGAIQIGHGHESLTRPHRPFA